MVILNYRVSEKEIAGKSLKFCGSTALAQCPVTISCWVLVIPLYLLWI